MTKIAQTPSQNHFSRLTVVYDNQIILSCSTRFQSHFILHVANSQLIPSHAQANRSCDLATDADHTSWHVDT